MIEPIEFGIVREFCVLLITSNIEYNGLILNGKAFKVIGYVCIGDVSKIKCDRLAIVGQDRRQ